MNFKTFYLLKENPDHAVFNVQGEEILKNFMQEQNQLSFVILSDSIFFTKEYFHSGMLSIIRDYFLSNFSKKVLNKKNITELGSVKNFFAQKFLDQFKYENYPNIYRTHFLDVFPNEILGRAWIEQIKGVDYMLVTIWNDLEKLNLKNLNLIKTMADFFDIKDAERIIFEINQETSKNIQEVISSLNISPLTGNVISADKSGLKPVHELPPEKKKEALIKMGAKPKTPVGLGLGLNRKPQKMVF